MSMRSYTRGGRPTSLDGPLARKQYCSQGSQYHVMSAGLWRARCQSTRGPYQRLRKQSAVMTIEAATTPWPCGGLCLEEVRHMDVKIA